MLLRLTRDRTWVLLPLGLTSLALLLACHRPLRSPSQPTSAPTTLSPIKRLKNILASKIEGDEVVVSQRPWYMRGGEQRPNEHDPTLALFPEDAPGDDRIVQQLMYKLPDEDVPVKKILLANGLGVWGVSAGRQEFLKNKCPVDRCSLTDDSRYAGYAAAIIYHGDSYTTDVQRPPKQIWIQYNLECVNFIYKPSTRLNWTATYRRDSDIVAPYERWTYYDPLVTENWIENNYAANKTKKVAWFVSNCRTLNNRMQYARLLSKYISVDIYGHCGSLECPRTDPTCLELLNKEYKFYLAFENANCRDYITEKLYFNGLQHNVLPIVMGPRPSEYAAAAPHNSYVHVDDFTGPKELAAYLRRLDEDDDFYNSYFKWKGTGEFINTFFFCRVCAMIHAVDVRQRSEQAPQ